MTSIHPVRVLALVVVVLGVFVVPLVAVGGSPTPSPATAQTTTDPAAGAHLSGVVGVQDSLVRETADRETFEARLANATSENERAELITQRLDATEQRLDEVETRAETLETARDNGSLTGDVYTARLAAVGETTAGLQATTNATEEAAASLSPGRRASLQIDQRVEQIRARSSRLTERTGAATDAVNGVGETIRAEPVTTDSIRDLLEDVTATSGSLRETLGSKQVNIHVRRANGQLAVFGVDMENGQVASVSAQRYDSPALAVYTDYQIVGQIERAADPSAVISAAIDNGDIRYDGRGITNSLQYGAVKIASMITGAILWLVPSLRRRNSIQQSQ
jgi:hypothetical protein